MTTHVVHAHHWSTAHHVLLRAAAFATAGVLTALYLALFFLVMDVEAGLSENTFGGYLFLAIGYAVLTLLVAFRDEWATYAGGAALQIGVMIAFAMFGIGVFGPGVFEYDAVSSLHMAWWAGATGVLELALFGLCVSLMNRSET